MVTSPTPTQVKVFIEISISIDDIAAFLKDWPECEEKLCEVGGVDSAIMEIPAQASRIDLKNLS